MAGENTEMNNAPETETPSNTPAEPAGGFDDLLREPDSLSNIADDDDAAPAAPAAPQAKEGAEPQTPPAQPAAPAAPAATPTPQTPAQPAAPVEPAKPQVPAQLATPAQPAAPQPAQPATPAETVDVGKLRQATIDEVAKQYFFTDEETAQLHEAPEKVLPTLAAKMVVQTYEAVSRTILSHLPSIIATVTDSRASEAAAEKRFFSDYPALNKLEYKDTLVKAANMVRQMNPTAGYEEVAPAIAAIVATQLKIQLGGVDPAAAQPAAPQPGAPPAAVARPHTPALPGATGAAPQKPADNNPFGVLAKEFEEID